MKSYGDGARAILGFKWKNSTNGHVIITEQQNGKTHYYCPQSNNANYRWYNKDTSGDVFIVRIDDKKFTQLIHDCCKEV